MQGILNNLTPERRLATLFDLFDNVLVTSSFGASAIYLLHLVQRVRPGHPIYFLDTGYHFDETHAYRQRLAQQYGFNIQIIRPDADAHQATREAQLWATDPDACCAVNKVAPMDELVRNGGHDLWLSGLMNWQSPQRQQRHLLEHDGRILKAYPILDVSPEDVQGYLQAHSLPVHPLVYAGYASIGCTHCTQPGQGREGRWAGTAKTECGLHRKVQVKA